MKVHNLYFSRPHNTRRLNIIVKYPSNAPTRDCFMRSIWLLISLDCCSEEGNIIGWCDYNSKVSISTTNSRRIGTGTIAKMARRWCCWIGESRTFLSCPVVLRWRWCPGSDTRCLLGLRVRPPDIRRRRLEQSCCQGLRPTTPVRGLPAHATLELCHCHRSEPLPSPISSGDKDRCLPDGTSSQGASTASSQPFHCGWHGTRQNDRSRFDSPRIAPAEKGENYIHWMRVSKNEVIFVF